MRRQAGLLEYLVSKWDPVIRAFQIELHTLEVEVEDLYFISGLSKRGAPVVISRKMNDFEETTNNYIYIHCVVGTTKTSGKIHITTVTNMPLRIILFTIMRAFESTGSHPATKS